ncbi:TerC family protein [Cellulomonas sp. zg-ZUI222]|uniref:TerC family protein n=1 Tax=Cellulomonas wangleii TaxID=2816956 RepID=A0ABX8D1G1_9CELL|nr:MULTISPECIES: TerC family protein [Cellulomonas]MBO0900247.1 TerC family protein [Cellulomonas sp. zg-ZUI22]MBO0920839.1 TerC family protein [Cellulomonas wangleii]MBO0926565.1 TerC family protein [Cellulomonas wangleii]QVI60871.1 TerC family protein [Cellulomonas wangleii]
MVVEFWVWAVTVGVILAMLAVDYVGHVRSPHEPTLRESAWWSAGYVGIALVFGVVVWAVWGSTYGAEYFAGYVTEKSLSVDNLFVFVLIMASFRVPRLYQQKVLLIGITIALVLRTIFILVGAAMIENLSWIFYVFGGFLLYTAWTQIKAGSADDEEYHENPVLRWTRRAFPTTDDYVGDKMVVRRDGRRFITPMLIVMIAIGTADIIFAVDSIPAIFGLTQETYLVFAANAFSLLGLRQLFFLIDGLLDKLVYLSYGLGAILGFIGAKLLIHAMHTNEVPFINGGEHITAIPEINTWVSLGFIIVTLTLTTILSLRRTRRDEAARAVETARAETHGLAAESTDGEDVVDGRP